MEPISSSYQLSCVDTAHFLMSCQLSPPLASQECFNSPYGCEYFKEYAEPVPAEIGQPGKDAGESCRALSQVARECKIFLVGGLLVTFVVRGHKCNHFPISLQDQFQRRVEISITIHQCRLVQTEHCWEHSER